MHEKTHWRLLLYSINLLIYTVIKIIEGNHKRYPHSYGKPTVKNVYLLDIIRIVVVGDEISPQRSLGHVSAGCQVWSVLQRILVFVTGATKGE